MTPISTQALLLFCCNVHCKIPKLYGCVFLGKSKSGFPNSKTDFAFFWANPKTDHESIKCWEDFSDQIQIRIFGIHNLSGFFGKGFEKKVFFTSGFANKNGVQQMPYMHDILTEPMLVRRLNFEPFGTLHSMFVIYNYTFVDCF